MLYIFIDLLVFGRRFGVKAEECWKNVVRFVTHRVSPWVQGELLTIP
jgi:hypothetical protein